MTEYTAYGFGETLRRRREQMGLSLNDVAVRTRVRKAYLQALEEENLAALPGSAYAIGFLRIYARHMDLAVEPLVASLTGKSVPEGERKGPSGAESAVARPRRRARGGRRLPILLVLLLLVLGGAGSLFYLQRQPAAPPALKPVTPAPPPVQPVSPPVPVPVPVPAATVPAAPAADSGAQAPEVVPLPVLPPDGAVVRVAVAGAGKMKVTLDGQDSRDYELQPGQKFNWKVGRQLQLELSAPTLIRCWVNDQEVALAELVAVRLVGIPAKEASRQ